MNNDEMRSDGDIKDVEVLPCGPEKFANLTLDPGFKIVLGTEGRSERLLTNLLRRVLNIPIVGLQFVPTERLGLTEEESSSFFDVYAMDDKGNRFLVEMQMWGQHYYHKRAVYYSSLSVQDQARLERKYQKEVLRRRKWNYYFPPVYVVSFLNFPNTLVEAGSTEDNPYVSHYVYRSKATGNELNDETNLVFVDLERFRKGLDNCKDDCERWLYSIKNMHLMNDFPDDVLGTELEELYHESQMAGWSAERRSLYERVMGNLNDYGNILEERFEDGMRIGLAKGLAKGEVKGREEGREEGREQGRQAKALEIARNMKAKGMSPAEIAALVGLTEEQVMALE